MCISTGTLKTINFPCVLNGKLMVLGVRLLKHSRLSIFMYIIILKENPNVLKYWDT